MFSFSTDDLGFFRLANKIKIVDKRNKQDIPFDKQVDILIKSKRYEDLHALIKTCKKIQIEELYKISGIINLETFKVFESVFGVPQNIFDIYQKSINKLFDDETYEYILNNNKNDFSEVLFQVCWIGNENMIRKAFELVPNLNMYKNNIYILDEIVNIRDYNKEDEPFVYSDLIKEFISNKTFKIENINKFISKNIDGDLSVIEFLFNTELVKDIKVELILQLLVKNMHGLIKFMKLYMKYNTKFGQKLYLNNYLIIELLKINKYQDIFLEFFGYIEIEPRIVRIMFLMKKNDFIMKILERYPLKFEMAISIYHKNDSSLFYQPALIEKSIEQIIEDDYYDKRRNNKVSNEQLKHYISFDNEDTDDESSSEVQFI